jgi:hypothetical protein
MGSKFGSSGIVLRSADRSVEGKMLKRKSDPDFAGAEIKIIPAVIAGRYAEDEWSKAPAVFIDAAGRRAFGFSDGTVLAEVDTRGGARSTPALPPK